MAINDTLLKALPVHFTDPIKPEGVFGAYRKNSKTHAHKGLDMSVRADFFFFPVISSAARNLVSRESNLLQDSSVVEFTLSPSPQYGSRVNSTNVPSRNDN